MKKILQKQLVLPVFLLLGAIGNLLAQGSTNMLLVAETDFSCSALDSTTNYASIDEVDGFGNSLIEPRLSTSLLLTTTTRSTAAKSDFLSKAQYAITSNPKKLDELRMLDEEGWGFVSSTTVSGKVILSLSVSGLKDNSNYRVEIEYYVPLTADEIKSSSYNVSLRAVVNPTAYNETSGASTQGSNQLPDLNTLREGYTNTLSITQASMNCRPISGGALNLYISSEKGGLGQAIMIKSIKVYGTPDATVSGPKEVCAGGESILLSVASSFTPAVTYQWYRKEGNSGVKLTGETGMRLKHVSGKVENKTTTYYYMAIIPDGKGGTVEVKSNELTVKDIMCCMDDNGNPMSQKIIWQDDFGTFTSGTEYWTWDYTDLSNPKKVTHQTSGSDKWITDLPYDIPGAIYNNETGGGSPRPEGWYRVVSFLSDQGGADLGWTAQAYDGKSPSFSSYGKYSNGIPYFPDHTYQDTSAMGGMLMLNMGCNQGDIIYQRVIRGIKEKKLTFRCYINTFSDTRKTPVAIYVRAIEVDDSGQPVGSPYVSDVVEKLASNDPESTDWKEVKVELELTQHSNVSVEIITNVGDGIEGINNAQGNDLLLDDIQLLACTEMKDPDTTIIKCTESARPVIYANGKDVKSIRLKSGESVTLTSNNVTTTDINGEPYTDFTMSWHKDDATSKALKTNKGVVADSLVVKWEDADKNGTTFILKVQDNTLNANGEKIDDCNSYDTIIVYADAAPETENYCLDDNGNQTPLKLVWQDDFGTFTSETVYWTWDYTDLSNPKKVTHQTTGGNKWITDLPYEIPGAVYNGMKKGEAPRPEGWYRVVSFLSDQGGADLGWTAIAYDGTYPNKSKYALKKDGVSYFPDHTYQDTSAMGGMLQINMGCYKGEVIYSRVISGLCEKTMVFKCFINTFSDNYGTPVSIYLRATEIDDSGRPVGTPFVSDPVEKLAINDRESAGWKEVRVAFELTRTRNVMLEIVSNNGDGPDGYENNQGNDLLLDDIQLFTCGTPDVNIYFDKNLSEKETVACEGESIGLYVDESEAIKSYWNGNPYYMYQYSTTPDNSKSWKTIVTTEDNHCLVQHSSSDSLGQNEKVYYRCVIGTLFVLEALENEISLGYFRPNDPCGEFSISTPIERTVYCVTSVETQPAENIDEIVNVYTITGTLVKSNVRRSKALDGLKKGSYYIVGHEKVLVDL
ncbi:MAG: hypothetical protein IKX43_05835 [Paludibacteraceae bacterium]|nr:hypothetical protein [Paludibacteraceae bacterium]